MWCWMLLSWNIGIGISVWLYIMRIVNLCFLKRHIWECVYVCMCCSWSAPGPIMIVVFVKLWIFVFQFFFPSYVYICNCVFFIFFVSKKLALKFPSTFSVLVLKERVYHHIYPLKILMKDCSFFFVDEW